LEENERERERESSVGIIREKHNINNNNCYRGDMKFTAQNVPIQVPLVLLVKAGWRLGRAFRIAEHGVM
jgi:hypothetical protein